MLFALLIFQVLLGGCRSGEIKKMQNMLVSARGPDTDIYGGDILVNKEGVPTAIYNSPGDTCIATSTDADLIHWRKSPDNPVRSRSQAAEN